MQVDNNLKLVRDSLMFADTSALVETPPIYPESYITETPPANFIFTTREKISSDWITLLFMLGFILIAISKFFFRKRFNDLLKALWARNYSNQLMREGNIFKEQFGLTMFIIYIISTPLFYSLSIIYLFPKHELKMSLALVLLSVMFPIILWAYRIIFIKTTSFIFKTPKQSAEILTQLFIFNVISAVVILPLITLFYYAELPIFIITAISIWGLMQIYRFIRLFVIGFSYSIFSGLHLFLYLCTLEIVPIVILLKIISNF